MIQTTEQYQFLHHTLALYAAQLPEESSPCPLAPSTSPGAQIPQAWEGGSGESGPCDRGYPQGGHGEGVPPQ